MSSSRHSAIGTQNVGSWGLPRLAPQCCWRRVAGGVRACSARIGPLGPRAVARTKPSLFDLCTAGRTSWEPCSSKISVAISWFQEFFFFFFCTSRDVKPDNILLDEQGERQAYREPWEAKGESRGVLLYARTHFPFWTMTPVALSHRTRTPD